MDAEGQVMSGGGDRQKVGVTGGEEAGQKVGGNEEGAVRGRRGGGGRGVEGRRQSCCSWARLGSAKEPAKEYPGSSLCAAFRTVHIH